MRCHHPSLNIWSDNLNWNVWWCPPTQLSNLFPRVWHSQLSLFCIFVVAWQSSQLLKQGEGLFLKIYHKLYDWSLDLVHLLSLEITILHLWIHAITWLLKIACHLRAGHLRYMETKDIKLDCDKAMKEIQQVYPNNSKLHQFEKFALDYASPKKPLPWRFCQAVQGRSGGCCLSIPWLRVCREHQHREHCQTLPDEGASEGKTGRNCAHRASRKFQVCRLNWILGT